MKKYIVIGLVLMVGLMASCGKSNTQKTGDATGVSYFEYLQKHSFCDEGYVRIEDNLMVFYEYETGKSYPLCSDAYCEHIPYDPISNSDPECEATLSNLMAACIHGEYVYTVQESGWQQITIQKRNLKESGYKIVAELPYCWTFSQAYNAIVRDKAYLVVGEIDKNQEKGSVQIYNSQDLSLSLMELDLNSGDYKILFRGNEGEGLQFFKIQYAKEGAYCHCYYEDVEVNETTGEVKVNEYKDEFYYVPYGGDEVKELCSELSKNTWFGGEKKRMYEAYGISEKGVYAAGEDGRSIECHSFDGISKETLYVMPEEYSSFYVESCSGDYFILMLKSENQSYQRVGIDMISGAVTVLDSKADVFYSGAYGGTFFKHGNNGGNVFMELWDYKDIITEAGEPLLLVR